MLLFRSFNKHNLGLYCIIMFIVCATLNQTSKLFVLQLWWMWPYIYTYWHLSAIIFRIFINTLSILVIHSPRFSNNWFRPTFELQCITHAPIISQWLALNHSSWRWAVKLPINKQSNKRCGILYRFEYHWICPMHKTLVLFFKPSKVISPETGFL